MPPARETLDAAASTCCPAHRRARAFPRSRLSAQGGLCHRHGGAAFGGVTTVFDMPNTIPPTGTAEALAAKHRIAGASAHVISASTGLWARTPSSTCRRWSTAA
jgi:dihydroorotase